MYPSNICTNKYTAYSKGIPFGLSFMYYLSVLPYKSYITK